MAAASDITGEYVGTKVTTDYYYVYMQHGFFFQNTLEKNLCESLFVANNRSCFWFLQIKKKKIYCL